MKKIFLLPLVALILTACNNGASSTSVPTPSTSGSVTPSVEPSTSTSTSTSTSVSPSAPTVTTVIVTPAIVTNLKLGETKQLTANVYPSTVPQTVTWTTDNANIASVNESGLITANGYGTVKITATSTVDTKKFGSCLVSVPEPLNPVTEILSVKDAPAAVGLNKTIDPSSVSLNVKYKDNTTGVVNATKVTCDTTSEGTKTATAYYGSTLYIDFDVLVVAPVNLPKQDTLDYDLIGVESTTYADWSDVQDKSGAIYAGCSAGGNNSIQLKSKDRVSGIVSTTSAGTLEAIDIVWNKGTTATRKVWIFGSNTPYTSAADLYDDTTKGEQVAVLEIDDNDTHYEFTTEYKYFGIRSADGAIYLDEVKPTWLVESYLTPEQKAQFCLDSINCFATSYYDETDVTLVTTNKYIPSATINYTVTSGDFVTISGATAHIGNPKTVTSATVQTSCTVSGVNKTKDFTFSVLGTDEIVVAAKALLPVYGQDILAEYAAQTDISVPSTVKVSESNVNVAWSTDVSTPAVIISKNNVRIVPQENDVNVTLIATVSFGNHGSSDTKEYAIKVVGTSTEVPVTGVEVSPTSLSGYVGGDGQLAATISPSTATNKNVTWSSDKPAVASVDQTGKVSYVAAGTATITVTTEDGGFKATASVTVNANKVFNKITNISDFTIGKKVIIATAAATSNKYYAMSATQNTNNRSGLLVTIANNKITNPDDDILVATIVEGNKTGTFAFEVPNGEGKVGYLYAASSSKNYLRTQTNKDDNGSFAVTISDSGEATAIASGDNTRNSLKFNYNSGSPIFTCYTGGYTAISFYALEVSHNWDSEWTVNETHHWHKCLDAGCTEVKDYGVHVWDEGVITVQPTFENEGVMTYTCETCKDTKTETIPCKQHKYSTEWSSNATKHWHACTDEGYEHLKADEADHNFTETVAEEYLVSAATCESAAVYHKSCSVCGYEGTETFTSGAALVHPEGCTFHAAVAPTCEEDGNIAYYACPTCDKNFDATGKELTSIVDPATGHKADSTWHNDDTNHYHLCEHDCGTHMGEEAHTYDVIYVKEGLVWKKVSTCSICGYIKSVTTTEVVASIGIVGFTSVDDAFANATDGQTIHLEKALDLNTDPITLSGKKVTFDLNGNILAWNLDSGEYAFEVTNGAELTFTNSGALGGLTILGGRAFHVTDTSKLNLVKGTYVASERVVGVYGACEINIGKDATLTSSTDCVIFLRGDTTIEGETGLTVNVLGTINEHGSNYAAISGNGNDTDTRVKVTVGSGAVVNSTPLVGDAKVAGIFWPNAGTLIIDDGATVKGATGIIVKSGHLIVNGGTISGLGAAQTFEPSGSGSNETGDGICVINSAYPSGNVVVEIEGGDISSKNAAPVASYAQDGKTPIANFISGGTYNKELAESLIASGYGCYYNETTGKWEVVSAHVCILDGTTYYSSISEAVNAITDTEAHTITLLKDHTETNAIVIDGNKNITLNLGDFTLTSEVADNGILVSNATLILNGNNGEFAYTNTNASASAIVINDNDAVAVITAKVTSATNGIDVKASKSTTISTTVIAANTGVNFEGGNCFIGNDAYVLSTNDVALLGDVSSTDSLTVYNCVLETNSTEEGAKAYVVILETGKTFIPDGYATYLDATKGDKKVSIYGAYTIGENYYTSLQDAIDACSDNTQTTINLNADIAKEEGTFIPSNKNIIINLNGHTVTMVHPGAGSEGTKTQGLHIEEKTTISINNGTIVFPYEDPATMPEGEQVIKMGINNYANLTLQDVTVDVRNNSNITYALSNNFGSLTLGGNTNILTDSNQILFDLWYGMAESYDEGIIVTINSDFTGTLNGTVEYGAKSRITDPTQIYNKAVLDLSAAPIASISDITFKATSSVLSDLRFANIQLPAGYCLVSNGEGGYVIAEAVVQYNGYKFSTVQEAVDQVGEESATIVLLKDATTAGIVIDNNKNITFNLNNHTLTVKAPGCGSTGTETLGFQVNKGTTVAFVDGTIAVPYEDPTQVTGKVIKMVIQNYGDLTLENVVIDASANSNIKYVVSNNCGTFSIEGSTTLTSYADGVLFDVYYELDPVYAEGVIVSVESGFTGSLTGVIEYSTDKEYPYDEIPTYIDLSNLSIEQLATIKFSTYKKSAFPDLSKVTHIELPEGYFLKLGEDGYYHATKGTISVTVGSTDFYFDKLQSAVDFAAEQGTVYTIITLLEDITSTGVVFPSGMNVGFDLNNKTLTMVGPAAGSLGTETAGFQFLKDSNIIITSGTIDVPYQDPSTVVPGKVVKVLFQNYANLTLDDVNAVVFDNANFQEILSVNCGDVVITGNTVLGVQENVWLMDAYYWAGAYDEGCSITVDDEFTGSLSGLIGYGTNSTDELSTWTSKCKIDLSTYDTDKFEFLKFTSTTPSTISNMNDANITLPTGYHFIETAVSGYYIVGLPAVKVGDNKYFASLSDAVASVPADNTPATITLLKDNYESRGIVVNANQNITLDLNGKTLKLVSPAVGSTGTETNGFQLLKDSTVTIKNGTIDVPYQDPATITGGKVVKFIIQNYSTLTLEDVNIDATNNSNIQYVVSNNFGSCTIKGSTTLAANEGQQLFDVWYGMDGEGSYDAGVKVEFAEDWTGSMSGIIEYGAASRITGTDWTEFAIQDFSKLDLAKFANVTFVLSSTHLDDINDANIIFKDTHYMIYGGVVINHYSLEEIKKIADKAGSTATTETYYGSGYVESVSSTQIYFHDENGQYTTIAYKPNNISEFTDLVVGDFIMIKGKVKLYSGKGEFDSGCTIIDAKHVSYGITYTVTPSTLEDKITFDSTNPTSCLSGSTFDFSFSVAEGYEIKGVTVNGTPATENEGTYTSPVVEGTSAVVVSVAKEATGPATYDVYETLDAVNKFGGTAGTTNYKEYSYSSSVLSATFTSQNAVDSAGAFQIRTKNSNSGIVMTSNSKGKISQIDLVISSGTIDVYGKDSAYSAPSDLFGNDTKGTKIGSYNESLSITLSTKYSYIGIRSNDGASYLTSFTLHISGSTTEYTLGELKDTFSGSPYTSATSVTLPTNGTKFSYVELDWALADGGDAFSIADGKLNVTPQKETDVTATVTATASVRDGVNDKSKEFSVTAKSYKTQADEDFATIPAFEETYIKNQTVELSDKAEWTVKSGSSISISGHTMTITLGSAEETCVVTASITKGGHVFTKDYSFKVCPPSEPTSIEITTAGGATSVQKKQTLQFSATVAPAAASQEVTWSIVSGSDCASIDENGLLTATKVGSVTVKAVSKSVSTVEATKTIEVTGIPATGIALDKSSANVALTETLTLTPTVEPEDYDGTISWSSSDETVATVSNGVVSPVAEGETTITASINGHNATCAVNVYDASKLKTKAFAFDSEFNHDEEVSIDNNTFVKVIDGTGTASKWYTEYRIYSGTQLVIGTKNGAKIISVSINFKSTSNRNISTTQGTWVSPNWTGNESTLTFTASGRTDLLGFTVTYLGGAEVAKYTVSNSACTNGSVATSPTGE